MHQMISPLFVKHRKAVIAFLNVLAFLFHTLKQLEKTSQMPLSNESPNKALRHSRFLLPYICNKIAHDYQHVAPNKRVVMKILQNLLNVLLLLRPYWMKKSSYIL